MTNGAEGIAVSGGGIGGLTLAIGLKRCGFEVIVLERQARSGMPARGIWLWPNALAALDTIEGVELGFHPGR